MQKTADAMSAVFGAPGGDSRREAQPSRSFIQASATVPFLIYHVKMIALRRKKCYIIYATHFNTMFRESYR